VRYYTIGFIFKINFNGKIVIDTWLILHCSNILAKKLLLLELKENCKISILTNYVDICCNQNCRNLYMVLFTHCLCINVCVFYLLKLKMFNCMIFTGSFIYEWTRLRISPTFQSLDQKLRMRRRIMHQYNHFFLDVRHCLYNMQTCAM
jgi:hypothetical protein